MKRPLLITIIVLIVLLILPAFGFFGWFFKEKKPMNIVILDKTVHNLDRVKHRSLTWVLANSRFVKKDNKQKYLLRKDYYGFAPIKPLRSKDFRRNDYRLSDLIIMADSIYDAAYYADTYGVFFNDWFQGINRSRRSRKLYGGLNNNDYLLLVEMKKRNRMVILEHNTFGYPTDAYEKYRVEELFGYKSTGWTGQYYSSLDSTSDVLPPWVMTMYKKKYKGPWPFKNAGIVFLKGENEIVILEEGTHLTSGLPYIITDEAVADNYQVAPKVAFNMEFDVVDALENQVISKFKLETTEEGADLLDRHFLTDEFPAVIANPGENINTLYFCGDFATGEIPPWTASFGSLNILKSMLYKADDINDTRRFFWLYYKPLLSALLNDYYSNIVEE